MWVQNVHLIVQKQQIKVHRVKSAHSKRNTQLYTYSKTSFRTLPDSLGLESKSAQSDHFKTNVLMSLFAVSAVVIEVSNNSHRTQYSSCWQEAETCQDVDRWGSTGARGQCCHRPLINHEKWVCVHNLYVFVFRWDTAWRLWGSKWQPDKTITTKRYNIGIFTCSEGSHKISIHAQY